MADTFARVRHIVGTTAEWAANNIVLGSGEVGVERVSSTDIRIKVGDGSTAWASLPYASASSTTINAATQTALDAKVAKAGDTMTGLLILSGDPSAALGAVTKQYVDAINSSLTTSLNGKLATAGGTLTGFVTLHADPTSALHAVSKQYVDGIGNARVTKSGDTMTGFLTLHADPTSALHAATKQYVDGGAYQTSVGGSSAYAGKVVKLNSGGVIDSSMVPVNATYLGTVNVTLAYVLTGTYTAGDYFAVSVSGTVESSWNSKINGAPSTAGAGQFLIYNANGKFDLVGDTTSSSAISSKAGLSDANTFSQLQTFSGGVAPSFKIGASGGTEGGEFVIAKPPTSTLSGDIIVDVAGDVFRVFENASPFKGAYLNLPNLGSSVSSKILTTTDIITIANGGTGASSAATALTNLGAAGIGVSNTFVSGQTIGNGTGTASLNINGGHGSNRQINYYSGTVIRWSIAVTATSESGSNIGSDFGLSRFADDGTYIDVPFIIHRNTGVTGLKEIYLGTALSLASGGTGASTAAGARANLGITVGTTAPTSPATNDIWVDTN